MALKFKIVTPNRRTVGPLSVKSVSLPGSRGEITILPGHAKLLSVVETGVVAFETSEGKKDFAAVSSGFVEVANDLIVLMADTLEMAKDIDLDRATRAQAKAEAALREHVRQDMDIERWTEKQQRKLQRAVIRQQAASYLLNTSSS